MWNPLLLISTADWRRVILPELSRLELKVRAPEGQTSLQLPVLSYLYFMVSNTQVNGLIMDREF